MEDEPGESGEGASRRERLRRYVVYALILAASAALIYLFVWFGTQLGLQN